MTTHGTITQIMAMPAAPRAAAAAQFADRATGIITATGIAIRSLETANGALPRSAASGLSNADIELDRAANALFRLRQEARDDYAAIERALERDPDTLRRAGAIMHRPGIPTASGTLEAARIAAAAHAAANPARSALPVSRRRYSTRTDAIVREIVAPIEATGEARADEYNIDAIADELLGDYADGFAARPGVDFWSLVAAHSRK